jgi:ADP-heptose:LPS heptosyltransferase
MNKAIVTIVKGDKYQEIWKRAEPFFVDYADRCDAELIVLQGVDGTYPSPHWIKFGLYELLKKEFDRIAFIDADILIRPDAPSLFDVVPEDQFGIFNEGLYCPRSMCIHEVRKVFNVELPKWNGKDYYNTGVMVMSKQHRHIFKITEEIKPLRNSFGEQTYLNMKIISSDIKVFSLPYKFNRMSIMDRILGVSRLDSYLVHYAGFDILFGEGKTLKSMDRDIEQWKKNPKYEYRRKIFLWALGGLGDCISAEPTIRYMRETLYPEADMYVLTKKYFHPLYQHIKGITFLEEGEFVPEEIDAVCEFNTHPTIHDHDSEYATAFSKLCPHPLLNSIDWVSIACINMQLNRPDKTIKMEYTDKDLEGILNLYDTPEDLVLIHAGRGWETKTFPIEWWQKIIDDLDKSGIKVGLIGKEVSDEHGYVPVTCPSNGFDFRDKLTIMEMAALIDQAPVLISNDSAPIFFAAAFDNYIIIIPTCKEGDLIAPFRYGSQDYKCVCLNKKTIRADEPVRITDLKGWQMKKLPEGHTIEEYIPDVGGVVKQAINFFMQSKKLICINKRKEAVNE